MPPSAVLVLGGLSSVGRNVVRLLRRQFPDATVRVVDRTRPELAFLSTACAAAVAECEYVQANLNNPTAVTRVFDGGDFQWVINCTTQVNPDQSEHVYRHMLYERSICVATEAAKRNVQVFVHLGSAVECRKPPGTEEVELEPEFLSQRFMVELDHDLQKIPGLNLVIIRAAFLYGPCDFGVLTTAIVLWAMAAAGGERIPVAVSPDARRDMVHLYDVAKAMVHTAQWYTANTISGVKIFNCGCPQPYDVKTALRLLTTLYPKAKIDVSLFINQSTIDPELAQRIRNETNEDILYYWLRSLEADKIVNSPISPLFTSDIYSQLETYVDGSKLTRETGFEYDYAEYSAGAFREIIDGYVELNVWPKALLPE